MNSPKADLVLTAGNIFTGATTGEQWCTDIAICNGRIVQVGGSEVAKAYAGDNVPVIELGGKFVMPGIYDMHTHPDLALAPKYAGDLDIDAEDPSPQQVKEAILKHTKTTNSEDNPWVYGQYFVHFTFRQQGIKADKHWLDSFMPDRPVAIHDRSWGCLLVNSKALELAGINRDTRDPRNGYIERDEAGEPTGILIDGAYSLIYAAMPINTQAVLRAAYGDGQHFQSSRGVVGTKYVHVCEHRLTALKSLDDDGMLSTRVEAAISWQDDIFPVNRRWQLMAGERHYYRSARLSANAVKFHFDGTHESRSSFLATPWPGNDEWYGHLNLTPEHIRDMLVELDAKQVRVIAHCTGDGASTVFLDAVAEARRVNGPNGPRHQCAHCTLLLDENLARFRELNVTAEFSPVGWQPTPFAFARRDAFGESRMSRAYNFSGVINAGGIAVMGTDWPVSAFDPWIGFEAMITRKDPLQNFPGAFYGKSLTLEQAVKVMTFNGAWSMGIDHEAGSLEVGKFADLCVLDQNIFDVPVEGNLHRTRILSTLLAGAPTWDSQGLFSSAGLAPTWQHPAPPFSPNGVN